MGQQEVFNLLKGEPEDWFTSKEIAKRIGVTYTSVGVSVKRLTKQGFVDWRYRNIATLNGQRPREYRISIMGLDD